MKRVLFQSIIILAGVALGGVAGGYAPFHKYARDYALVRAFAWTGIFSAVSVGEYDKNSGDAKKELLYTLALYTQGVQSSALDPTMRNAFHLNRGLTEARLSVIESEGGNVEGAKAYLSSAQEDLKTVGWVDRSEASILQVVKRQPFSPCRVDPKNVANAATSKAQGSCS